MERVFYSSSVHDEAEIEAVVEVLRSGPQGLWPGRRVTAMERQVAALFGKSRGVMVNSGSSALYLAIELLDLEAEDEIVTCGLTFSTDIAPIVRAGLVPVLVDAEIDTFCVDVARVEVLRLAANAYEAVGAADDGWIPSAETGLELRCREELLEIRRSGEPSSAVRLGPRGRA